MRRATSQPVKTVLEILTEGATCMIRQLDANRTSTKADELILKFQNRIIGQPQALEAYTRVLEKYNSGIYDRKKPIASLLFLGPTGVGKTGSVEAFVEGLFGNIRKLMRVNCGEFQHSHEIAKLQGSPPGYLGHRETHPYFTNRSVRSKFCIYNRVGNKEVEVGQTNPAFTVILWDEIEKANDALWNLLLGVLDNGEMTTGDNEIVDFTPTVHIMTSNVGAKELAVKSGDSGMGFANASGGSLDYEIMKTTAMSAAQSKFPPEFLNRLDKTVVFRSLTPEDMGPILRIELDRLRAQIVLTALRVFDFDVSPSAKREIVAEGYDRRNNARHLKRTVEKYIGLPMARLVGTGQIMDNDVVIVDFVGGEWKYFAKVQTKSGGSEPSVQSGRVEVPTLREPTGAAPTPPVIPESFWGTYPEQLAQSVLEMPRTNPSTGIERRSHKRIL
jgi:ATP-dependent Clp protease ATP-binding subunit ClpA